MLDLTSPRWAQLRHAYGSAENVPDLLRALAAEEKPHYSGHPAAARETPTPWEEVLTTLYHQGSIYSATFAAFPHIVAIAEAAGLPKQRETLLLAGAICIDGKRYDGYKACPDDLRAEFDSAMTRVRGWSLAVARQADVEHSSTLAGLFQAFGALRFPASVHVQALEHFYDGDWQLEVDACPACQEYLAVQMADAGPVTIPRDARGFKVPAKSRPSTANRADHDRRIAQGQTILRQSADPMWSAADTPGVLAALALERGDHTLATRILDIDSTVVCAHCRASFPLAAALFTD